MEQCFVLEPKLYDFHASIHASIPLKKQIEMIQATSIQLNYCAAESLRRCLKGYKQEINVLESFPTAAISAVSLSISESYK